MIYLSDTDFVNPAFIVRGQFHDGGNTGIAILTLIDFLNHYHRVEFTGDDRPKTIEDAVERIVPYDDEDDE